MFCGVHPAKLKRPGIHLASCTLRLSRAHAMVPGSGGVGTFAVDAGLLAFTGR